MRLNEALAIKNAKREAAVEAADKKRAELHSLIPRVREIDAEIADIPMRVFGGENIALLRADSERLNAERARLLQGYGLPADYDEPAFDCPLCRDSGYTEGLRICSCVKKLAASAGYAESGALARGLSGKRFDNFLLDYYKNSDLKQMTDVLAVCRKYASSFPRQDLCGLVLYGGTGLGKTHLSAAIANEVSSAGYHVVYETAQQIFDTFDGVRFNKLPPEEKDKYERCDLLLIDDLGAECKTPYSVATIANLIDLRMVNGKQTVISTNMSPQEISKAYGERVFSRLLGEFKVLRFSGSDVRMQKIVGDKN